MKQIKKSLKVHLQHYKNLEVLTWNFFVRKLFCESFANFIRKDWLFSRIVGKGNVFSFEFCKTFQSSYSVEHLCMAASKNVVLKLIWNDRQSLLEAAYLSCLFVFGSIFHFFPVTAAFMEEYPMMFQCFSCNDLINLGCMRRSL